MRAQLARVDAVIVQAVIAGALSFSHLHDLADAAGQGGWKAWAYPVSVDLLLVAAWRRMREQQRAGQPAGGRDCGSSSPWPHPSGPTSPPPGSSTWTTFRRRSASWWPAGPPSPSSAEPCSPTHHAPRTRRQPSRRPRRTPKRPTFRLRSMRPNVTRFRLWPPARTPIRSWPQPPNRSLLSPPRHLPRRSPSRPLSSTESRSWPRNTTPPPAGLPTPTPYAPGSACRHP